MTIKKIMEKFKAVLEPCTFSETYPIQCEFELIEMRLANEKQVNHIIVKVSIVDSIDKDHGEYILTSDNCCCNFLKVKRSIDNPKYDIMNCLNNLHGIYHIINNNTVLIKTLNSIKTLLETKPKTLKEEHIQMYGEDHYNEMYGENSELFKLIEDLKLK